MAAKSKEVDLESLSTDVRAGILSYEQMVKKHGISKGRISQIKKEHGWETDLAPRIKAKAEAKLNAYALNGKLNKTQKIADDLVVEAGANLQANLLIGHREEIGVLKQTIVSMAQELGTLSYTELQDALELVLREKTEGLPARSIDAMYKAFESAMALGGRTSAGKNLVVSLASLIDKERQAYGIDKNVEGPQSIGEFLSSLKE